ncbi:MAG: polysaccharide deacetylase family protein [bacterium]|jgi:peptidoglycan/xylan/chitin deacetylase (PgdA/CDA1 family)|nr:polysaccharide deacetylase family protein [bacterium]
MRPIPVLTWHKISRRREAGLTVVSPGRFLQQVEALVAHGARAISLEDYLGRRGRQGDDERLCLLAFDDAYVCVAEEAHPVLARRGLPATLFPVLDWIGLDNGWDRSLAGRPFRHLDEDGIARLLAEGWSLGLHGRSHRHLAGRGLAVLEQEVVKARAELELRFGRSVHALAWPYGRCDRRAVLVAEAAGLRLGFGNARGDDHPLCRRRHLVYPLHGPAALRAMLDGAPPDHLQRLAARGAWLASLVGGGHPPHLV